MVEYVIRSGMPIVVETEQIPNRRNSPFNSRARFFWHRRRGKPAEADHAALRVGIDKTLDGIPARFCARWTKPSCSPSGSAREISGWSWGGARGRRRRTHRSKLSYALHVYDGDFLAAKGKSCWDAETLAELPYDGPAVSPMFGQALAML
jgi:hypothetical protein